MEQLEGTFKDGEEIKKSLCESISGVNERKTEEENFTNLAFENSQIGELLDDKKPIEQDAEIGVTQACKDLCEEKPKDIILLENNIQEAKKENCFIKTSIENRVDDEHLDGSPGKVSLEFSFSIACSDENMGFSKDSQTDMSSGNRDVNTTRFKQDIEELKTECEKNSKMKVGEVILMDDVRVDRRSPHVEDGSSTMNTCEGDDNKASQLKPRLQDECFEQGKNDLETGSELICQEITPETHTNEGHSVMKSEKPRNEENTNSDHAIISTADQTDSNLHNKFTDASNVNDNEHELQEASSHASTNGDGSVDREPVDRKTQKAETDFIAENIVKEDQFVLCGEDKTETKEPSSVEICETHEPISDERKVIELEKRDPLLRKTKLARQPHIDHSLLSNKSDEYAPTPPGAESIANHTNTSSDNQVSSSTLSGFPREVNDNFENNTSTSSRIQTSQEMPSTNSLPSRDSVAEHSAVSVQSPDNNMCEPSNTEIPLASTRLLTRFPKKLVKTLSNPPGGIVERGAVIDTSSPCTSSGQEPTKCEFTMIYIFLLYLIKSNALAGVIITIGTFRETSNCD